MRADARTRSRVGIIVFASLVIFAGIIMVIGGKTGFFLARTSYFARFPNSQGLVEGNQVRLAGVTVGSVRKIEVPGRPGEDLTLHFDIEKRYQHLVKTDSRVEIKTIGLLGDKYLEVSVGSPDKPDLEPDHEIMAYRGAELEKILAGSGDLVDNVVAITKSLKTVLGRTERGEGFLGEITSPEQPGKELSRSLRQTIDSANALLVEMRQGRGLLSRLINDPKLADSISSELEGATGSLHRILASFERGTASGDGLLPALLNDPEGKKRFFALLDSLKTVSDGLSAFSQDLAAGEGALPKLLKDPEFAKEFLGDLKRISSHLSNVAAKLDSKEGSVGRLISDPSVSDAINDVIVGIDRSKPLRWLIRNRQRSGIDKRYREERTKAGLDPNVPPGETDPPAPTPAATPAPPR
ncbi:MAG TPA: MlaD family protein [Thermoanaerobaculia bacterium]|nr:MlaD family protein [Thermoanaerobaculia bacterium]